MLIVKWEERKYLEIELFINKEVKIKDLENYPFIHIAKTEGMSKQLFDKETSQPSRLKPAAVAQDNFC